MTDSKANNAASLPPTTSSASSSSSSSSTQDLRRRFFATPSNQETTTRDACTSPVSEQPQQVPQSSSKPRPAPRATLSALFPPENLSTPRARTSLPASSTEQSTPCQPFKSSYSFKDYASAVHPTAPRVPAPISPALKPPPPITVRGPKGVSHPHLKELLQISKAKLANIFPRQSATFTDVAVGPNSDIVPPQEESKESADERSSSTSSSGYHDAYAELVRELARHEDFAAQYCAMPVHETAFLPQGSSPQRGTAAPWLKPINPTRDSEGYTTTDDEFEGVPLRRAYSSRNYPKNNGRFVDDRTRSLSPPPVLIRPITTRVSMEAVPSNKQLAEAARMRQQQQLQLVVLSPEQMRYHQANLGQVLPMQQPPSPWQRGSPMRASVGSNPSRGRPQIFGVIKEERAEEPPMMRRTFSLNAQQVRRGQSVTLPNLRTQSSGLLDACPKRVSFSNLPSSNDDNSADMRDRPSGVAQFPQTPSRRPSSSDSVFLYSPIKYEAPDKPLPPVPEDRISCQAGGRPTANVIVSTPTNRWHNKDALPQRYPAISPESESGSEAGEIQRILFKQTPAHVSFDDEWTSDGKARGPPGSDPSAPPGSRDEDVRRGGGGSRNRRDEPRRHTLSGDQQAGGGSGAGSAAANLSRSMDLERSYYHQPAPISSSMFDDDPGIMSEVETASTGFRRGGKQRSSLPVVRTPSKTLERPLGLVFLQYRNETKRALLPNEITSIDTVKALFVRSFPKQLTMEYLDSPMVKIYIHDSSKDMFYELEDLRSHLRDIRDRSVLRLFETPDINGGAGGGVPVGGTPMPGGLPPHPTPAAWDQDQSYFSEPEFDSEYQHQHIHKTKGSSKGGSSPYYMAHSYPPGQPGAGGAATLPRGAPVIRAYSPATKQVSQAGATSPPTKPQRAYQEPSDADLRSPNPPCHLSPNQPRPQSTPPRPPERWAYLTRSREPIYADRLHTESGYMSSPERGRPPYAAYPAAGAYEDPYYQYGPRSGSITPVIDEEASDSDELLMDSYSIYSSKVVTGSSATTGRSPQPTPRPSFPATGNIASQSAAALVPYDATRIRVEHMERQLANLTGLVQKALTQGSSVVVPGPRDFLQIPTNQRDAYRNADTKPTKPAIKSSTLPRTSSQERDRHKPAPPPKPMSLSSSHPGQYDTSRHLYRADLQLTPEMYNHLRVLQKKAKDLRQEVRNLRRMSQAQAHSVRETIRDTFIKIRAMLLTGGGNSWLASGDSEKLRVSREEELYKQEMLRLEKDLTELESTVEELRGNVINKKTRVNMSDVENMALVLSKSSKTVADLKVRFPNLQDGMKSLLSSEMEKVVREEKFLKEEPERLESALRRCKKLTGTLVTLKRLASVQEQRLPIVASNNIQDQQNQRLSPDNLLQETSLSQSSGAVSPQSKSSGDGCSPASSSSLSARGLLAPAGASGGETSKRQENALDTLLDELQTFARPPSDRHGSIDASTPTPQSQASGTLRRLHSYPSSDSSSPVRSSPISRLQVLEDSKPPSLPERSKVPPPPPPRTSSRSPLVSPTSPPRLAPRGSTGGTLLLRRKREPQNEQDGNSKPLSSNSSSSESINSQEGLRGSEALEQRHQELLRRQRQLQEQYARLQQLQRNVRLPQAPELKKTGSESNLLRGLNLSAAPTSGSLTHLAPTSIVPIAMPSSQQHTLAHSSGSSKIYETDIL